MDKNWQESFPTILGLTNPRNHTAMIKEIDELLWQQTRQAQIDILRGVRDAILAFNEDKRISVFAVTLITKTMTDMIKKLGGE